MKTHAELIQHLIDSGMLMHQHIIDAFMEINRADFMSEGTAPSDIYADHAFPIGYGQTISQPSTVAFMFELLQPQLEEKILDVGTGSGWTTALLRYIVGERGYVYGTEIIPELVFFSHKNVAKYFDKSVAIAQASHDCFGDMAHAPYDRILVSAAATEIPNDLIAQLKVGGVMVIPVGSDIAFIRKKTIDSYDCERHPGFAFVPLMS
ncbi:MAG: hypothetical protein ACD_15C00166G0010 [uncultured bacterium]|nr:MAG: hypothetical protein ACD_15C00166G0010 [uncultured bacterium]HCU70360.1 protein-L-isoaspartate O-methyltransferase [Candidatus Moranbacteria bacterium]